MPEFFFQQFASRDARGYRWLDGAADVPALWLERFQRILTQSGTVPKNQEELCGGPVGGVFLAGARAFGAVYRFREAPRDFSGRTGGIVINALFFRDIEKIAHKSLKKAWGHQALQLSPAEASPGRHFILLDDDFGATLQEQEFFSCLQRRSQQDALYTCRAGKPIKTFGGAPDVAPPPSKPQSQPPPQPQPRQNVENSPRPTERRETEKHSTTVLYTEHQKTNRPGRGEFMMDIRVFLAGMIVGCILGGIGSCWHKDAIPSKNATNTSVCDYDIEALKKLNGSGKTITIPEDAETLLEHGSEIARGVVIFKKDPERGVEVPLVGKVHHIGNKVTIMLTLCEEE